MPKSLDSLTQPLLCEQAIAQEGELSWSFAKTRGETGRELACATFAGVCLRVCAGVRVCVDVLLGSK